MDAPVGQLMNIVMDCPDADISARFCTAVLGWERVQDNADAVDIADASDGRRRPVFQQIADHRPPGWPDQGPPQQLHLDVRVDDLEIAHQRVRALGAVPLGERVVLEDEIYWVYADPAGHPFAKSPLWALLAIERQPRLSARYRSTSPPERVNDVRSRMGTSDVRGRQMDDDTTRETFSLMAYVTLASGGDV